MASRELTNKQRRALGVIFDFCVTGDMKYFGYNTFSGIGRKTIDGLKRAGCVAYYEYPNLFKLTEHGVNLCKNGAVKLPDDNAMRKLKKWNHAAK